MLALAAARLAASRTARAFLASRATSRAYDAVAPLGHGGRRLALYLAHVGAGQPIKRLARQVGAAPSYVRRAVVTVEEWRDDAEFDSYVADLAAQAYEGRAC